MKNFFTVITLLFFLAAADYVRAINQAQTSVVSDGVYIGLEKMPNLSPDEPDTSWFHENRLLIRNDEAILDKLPIAIRNKKKEYSASDGGFLTYRARFMKKDGQAVVALRLFQSDYILFPADKHDQYTEIKTYSVKFLPDGIEFNGVTYKRSKLHKLDMKLLTNLLNTEPLEKPQALQ